MDSKKSKKKNKVVEVEEDEVSDDDTLDTDDEEETIARIQRAHFAQAAAMNARRRSAPRARPMSAKRKMEAVKNFHDFTKKLKHDTGITIRSLMGNNILELSDYSSGNSSSSDSDGLSEEEFVVNPNAVEELNEENESYIDPETGDIVESKKSEKKMSSPIPEPSFSTDNVKEESQEKEEPKTLSISDILNDGELDLSKNVEIAEVDQGELCTEKTAEELLDIKQEETSQDQDYDITEKLKEMGEISVKPLNKDEEGEPKEEEKKSESEEEKKVNPNALNVRRNIREVMDEKNLDASTLAAQRQESERLARVQEQQRIIREVQRQIALNRQNKIHQKTLSLLQGGSSILKQNSQNKINLANTVVTKMPSGEMKKTVMKQGQAEVSKIAKPTTSGAAAAQKPTKSEQKTDKKEVVEIVSSSSGEESSSSSSDSDDCIMLSDSEVPPSPEAEDDPNNSGLHVNDAYNIPDEQGRVLINIGHPENEEDIFLAPQIARVIKPHQIGGVRFLFDNIIESVERFSTSTGFGCILAHSMGLGKTLQIVCFCDIFLRHTNSKTVLCIMPINTLQNWVAEFNMWLPLDATNSPLAAHGEVRPRNFPIYVLNDSHKTLQMRAKVVKDWSTTGGVLMIGYELYRLLSMKKDKKPRKKRKDAKQEADKDKDKDKDDKKQEKTEVLNEDTQGSDITNQSKISDDAKPEKEDGEAPKEKTDPDVKEEKKEDTPTDEEKRLLDEMYEALVRPGPDLVICDEGHRIKNTHSNISYALKQMRTKRRVVLTGYPLQNNLLEYWCMVDFVRPNYLGSKTEFCNMFERPIQNGQCIDSTPQDIRLMRYRAHVLHSLLVGFVQRRSHAVLQSTLPQKEEYVLLVRMTPLQRKLYDRFMNEVVRSTSVPNPLKAFAICCKIWNHPDVLYHFLRKRSEANAMIEEDLDLEELRGVTKAGRARNSKAASRRGPAKPRGAAKKPAATIPPNTSSGPGGPRPDTYGNPPCGPPNQPGGPYPPYPNYQNQPGYYPPNQGYNQNYEQNYFPQQAPYGNNYPNQYPQNNPEWNQGYQQNNWGSSNYYGNPGYYNNPQYPNGQSPQDFRGISSTEYNNPQQQYPPGYNVPPTDSSFPGNAMTPYQNNQDGFANPQQRPPYQAPYPNQPGYSDYNNSASGPYPNNASGPPYPNNAPPQSGPSYTNNVPPQSGPSYPNSAPPQSGPSYTNNVPPQSGPTYPNNAPPQNFENPPYFPPYEGNNAYDSSQPAAYNQYQNNSSTYSTYPPSGQLPQNQMQPNQPSASNLPIKNEPNVPPNYPTNDIKTENTQNNTMSQYGSSEFNYNQQNMQPYPDQGQSSTNDSYPCQYPGYNQHHVLETKPPLSSAGSNSPITSWPITETLKTEVDKFKAEEKIEMKSESDGEVKIEDLDTKKIVKDDGTAIKENSKIESKTDASKNESQKKKPVSKDKESKGEGKSDESESEEQVPKRGRPKGSRNKEKKGEKPKAKAKPRSRKDRKTSKDKNDDKNNSESEESEKEEKLNREEEIALMKKAEEMTYDWAAELLKDYIPGIIENSAKMELFFYILNESIKLGDRLLLFSQSLFTLNLIEDFLERNYIPGTNCLWERNTNYYRLDGSTHALEREKLINEFNANPHIYLFLVSTRAGSLGINLVGANRVIVFDASWNPCHDTQAVCRVYRYGQKKPCFVYRFVMDCCLEKKIYDRQINKQGMADRVVDECNPDAVLSMKEITNLCFDNDEKEPEPKDLSEHKDKYIDILMQGILGQHGQLLTKEPFQHESLLVDRKEKKLSSAEKRLAQRGYELEKKAASAPKPTTAYRTVRAADGSLVQRPVASVRPMQHGARWIPADVWRRQGMTAQEMTLPLDVVIPTNSAEKTNIVLKAGQRVMVLKSPKGIYMQLESGKIIAIKTSFKGLGGQKGDNQKDSPIGKKILGNRPSASIPGSLKNNSAITITPKTGPRPGFQRIVSRTPMGQKLSRPMLPGQKLAEIRNRLGEMKAYGMRPKLPLQQGKLIRPGLTGSVSITKIPKEIKKPDTENGDSNLSEKMELDSEEDAQILDSDDEESKSSKTDQSSEKSEQTKNEKKNNTEESKDKILSEGSGDKEKNKTEQKSTKEAEHIKSAEPVKSAEPAEPVKPSESIVLTTDEILPSEEALDKQTDKKSYESPSETYRASEQKFLSMEPDTSHTGKKINLLKNYRHQRPGARQTTESSLSQLERTAIALNKEGMPDFRRNLDDITQSYSPGTEERTGMKSKKKKSPNKPDSSESQSSERQPNVSGMSHSVSSLLGNSNIQKPAQSTPPLAPVGQNSVPRASAGGMNPSGMNPVGGMHPSGGMSAPSGMGVDMSALPGHAGPDSKLAAPASAAPPAMPMSMPPHAMPPAQGYPVGHHPPDAPYGQYPGYGMGYGGYPNAPYYGGYGGAPPYYAGYGTAPPYPPAPPSDPYLPPNPQQW